MGEVGAEHKSQAYSNLSKALCKIYYYLAKKLQARIFMSIKLSSVNDEFEIIGCCNQIKNFVVKKIDEKKIG